MSGNFVSDFLAHPFIINGLPLWGILVVAIIATSGLGKEVSKLGKDVEVDGSKTREEVRSEHVKTREHAEKQRLKDRIEELEKKLNGNKTG